VHVVTTLAVIIYFRERFISIIRGAFNDLPTRHLVLMLALSFTVTAVVGLLLSPWVTAAFESPVIIGGMLLVIAALISTRFIPFMANTGSLFSITWKVALIIGLAQGIAVFPGISRSGLTVIAALWLGQSRSSAAEFSFLLAVPTVLAASLFSLIREPEIPSADLAEIVVAGIVAFIVGFLTIHWLMRWLQRGHLWWFSGYCAVVGAASLLVWGFDLL
jgi:undecaprenyl-diphosphatase